MSTVELTEILVKVLRASQERKIDWKVYIGASGGYSAKLGSTIMRCLNNNGIHQFIVTDVNGAVLQKSLALRDSEKVGQILELAKRKALNIDARLDELNRSLDEL